MQVRSPHGHPLFSSDWAFWSLCARVAWLLGSQQAFDSGLSCRTYWWESKGGMASSLLFPSLSHWRFHACGSIPGRSCDSFGSLRRNRGCYSWDQRGRGQSRDGSRPLSGSVACAFGRLGMAYGSTSSQSSSSSGFRWMGNFEDHLRKRHSKTGLTGSIRGQRAMGTGARGRRPFYGIRHGRRDGARLSRPTVWVRAWCSRRRGFSSATSSSDSGFGVSGSCCSSKCSRSSFRSQNIPRTLSQRAGGCFRWAVWKLLNA